MGRPKVPPQLPPPPPPADPADPAVQERKRREREQTLAMAGRASTFKTGPAGVPGPAPTMSKSLLGS